MSARVVIRRDTSPTPQASLGVPERPFPVQAKSTAAPRTMKAANDAEMPARYNPRAVASFRDVNVCDNGPRCSSLAEGDKLPSEFRKKMEMAFQADFSDIRVHRDAPDAQSLSALAFTQGRDIHFAPGKYNPASAEGQKIIAHELAHVMQQRSGKVRAPETTGIPLNADPSLEQEADAMGGKAERGERVGIEALLSGSQGLLTKAPIQPYCGAPGCNDPNCHDESNHGFNRVYDLRSGPLYNFTVNPGDRGQGTNTTQGTRGYVNAPNAYYPQEVRMSYSDGGQSGFTEFENAPLQTGQRADAGHIRGRQNGGFGDQNPGVFAQNPQQNRGNYLNGAPTRDLWRQHEDNQNTWAQNNPVNVSVALRDTQRPQYPPESSISDQEYQAFMDRWG